jgi:ABC-type uncharacterized transport system involved in gliding motility auxiliary subunit
MAASRTSGRSRWWWGLNAAAALGLALALVLMANLLARRHPLRLDWSAGRSQSLSGRTLSLLNGLDEEVEALVCFRSSDPLLRPIRTLLRDYSLASPRLRVEVVDPDRDIARAKALAPALGGLEPNVVVFRNARRRVVVRRDDLAVFDDAPVLAGQPARLLLFKGESAFSSALQRLDQEGTPRVYFLSGHGERSLEDYDPAGGYSDLARFLRRQNLEPRTLFLGDTDAVPSDAAALVVAGPSHPLAPAERDRLRDYLERGGRLMALLDLGTRSDLEPFLAEWGVRVGPQRVVDKTLTGRDVLVRLYGRHPAVAPLAGITTILNLPRLVQPLAGSEGAAPSTADRPTVSVLAWTSEDGFATPDLESAQPAFNDETDLRGPVALAVAAERGPAAELNVELAPTRLVVIGDSSLVANGAFRLGYNTDFFMAALNWLLERDQVLPIEPRPPGRFRIILGQRQATRIFWLLVVGFPSVAVAAGWLVRRRRLRESRGAWRS